MRKRILALGCAYMNIVMDIERMPTAETAIRGDDYSFVPGGVAGSAAVCLAKFGNDSVLCARIGDDENGSRLVSYYSENGVDARYLLRDPQKNSGFSAVMREKNGSVRSIVYQGANDSFGKEDLENGFMSFPDALYLPFEAPDREIIVATRLAQRQGIPVFIDAGPKKLQLPLELLENVEIFSPDEEEVFTYTGIYPNDAEKCLKASMMLMEKVNAKYIVLKLGRRGSYIYDGKYYFVIPPYDTTSVAKNRAGTVFTAAMTSEYLRHGDIEKACKYANMAGAVCVSNETGDPFPKHSDIKNLADKLGVSLDD